MADSDSELEEDEEEILVYVEFDDCETNDVFCTENLNLDMLGLDSDHPVMQVNGKFFEGTYEDAVGTYLFFDKDNNPAVDDPVFDKVPTIKYFNKTRKLLRMKRAFVVPRFEVVGDSKHPKCVPNLETIKEAGVPQIYQEEALSFWENSRNTRLDALQKYLKKQEFRKELRLRGFEPDSASDDDNPFAMYKHMDSELEVNHFEKGSNKDYDSQIEKLKNSLQMTELDNDQTTKKLTVIDPGPSTSKSSVPWVEDDVSDHSSGLNKVKSIGRVREKVIKGKVQKKPIKKKKLSVSEKSLDENGVDKSSDAENENNSLELENEVTPNSNILGNNVNHQSKKNEKILKNNDRAEEMEVDPDIEESERLLSKELGLKDSYISEKEKRKLEKREARKKEISERLKALSENASQSNS